MHPRGANRSRLRAWPRGPSPEVATPWRPRKAVLVQRAWIVVTPSRVTGPARRVSDSYTRRKVPKTYERTAAPELPGATVPTGEKRELLEGDLGAFALELGLRLLGGLLVDLLQDRLRRGLDHVLGLLEAQAGQLTHDLDDLDLLATVGLEDDVELVLLLLLRRGGTGAGRSGGNRD